VISIWNLRSPCRECTHLLAEILGTHVYQERIFMIPALIWIDVAYNILGSRRANSPDFRGGTGREGQETLPSERNSNLRQNATEIPLYIAVTLVIGTLANGLCSLLSCLYSFHHMSLDKRYLIHLDYR
jgi:hypothetical protein